MKFRFGYVSNSSASSYILKCKSIEDAFRVIDCYQKFLEYYYTINPKSTEFYMDENNFKIVSIDEIRKHFENCCTDKETVDYNMKQFEGNEGSVFILGTDCSDDGTPESEICHWFIDDFLPHIHKENGEELEVDIEFKTRWS